MQTRVEDRIRYQTLSGQTFRPPLCVTLPHKDLHAPDLVAVAVVECADNQDSPEPLIGRCVEILADRDLGSRREVVELAQVGECPVRH